MGYPHGSVRPRSPPLDPPGNRRAREMVITLDAARHPEDRIRRIARAGRSTGLWAGFSLFFLSIRDIIL